MSLVQDHTKYFLYDNEEPPAKKIISDGDLLIKKLVEKQRNTKVNLKEQLLFPKVFERSAQFVSVTSNLSGKCALTEFEDVASRTEQRELYKSAGLTDEDIQMVFDFHDGTLYDKRRKFEETLLTSRINRLLAVVEDFRNKSESLASSSSNKTTRERHKSEFGLSVKPESVQTKLLKFALQNEQIQKSRLPHPMDNVKEMERKLVVSLNTKFESPARVQKRLRKLARKVDSVTDNDAIVGEPKDLPDAVNVSTYVRNSKWDSSTVDEIADVKAAKIFTCRPRNYYTVRNREIIKLSGGGANENKNLAVQSRKLSLDQIKSLPKFANYEVGSPSKIVYAKNLPKSIKESDLKLIFSDYAERDRLVFRVMSGKMKGQAFITFPSVNEATAALQDINGTVIGDEPIVLEFGRRNK